MRRPRLDEPDLEIILKALDLYICNLEEQAPPEEEKKINESVFDFMNSPRYLLRKSLLAEAIFKEASDEFTVVVTEKPGEVKGLLEVGFEYVCKHEGLMYFRKRK